MKPQPRIQSTWLYLLSAKEVIKWELKVSAMTFRWLFFTSFTACCAIKLQYRIHFAEIYEVLENKLRKKTKAYTRCAAEELKSYLSF